MMETPPQLDIIGRSEDWICVSKPGGISVHNAPGKDVVSLISRHAGGVRPVHRLDRDTSGVLLLALDKAAAARLTRLFAQGRVEKRYRALVHGNFNLPKGGGGTWDAPLSRQAGGRKDPAGRGRRQQAVTRFKVLDQSPHYTLLDIRLVTGRKHQIRRHAKLHGHPVVGDRRYGSPRALAFLRDQRNVTAMGLHSWRLSFEDRGKSVTLEQPRLPADICRLFREDR